MNWDIAEGSGYWVALTRACGVLVPNTSKPAASFLVTVCCGERSYEYVTKKPVGLQKQVWRATVTGYGTDGASVLAGTQEALVGTLLWQCKLFGTGLSKSLSIW
jgi:outer membrane biogenesis lipoprotein LolB